MFGNCQDIACEFGYKNCCAMCDFSLMCRDACEHAGEFDTCDFLVLSGDVEVTITHDDMFNPLVEEVLVPELASKDEFLGTHRVTPDNMDQVVDTLINRLREAIDASLLKMRKDIRRDLLELLSLEAKNEN